LNASHKLVANKTFGWSRLFADLESVLPGSVSASRIAVENIYQDGDRIKAELELGAISRDYQSVMVMIENMNNSGLFQAELRGQDLQKNERITYTEYTFRLIYTPGYGYSTSPSTDIAQNEQGGRQ
jgi:Tfp pilus assembly protein PilN